MNSNESATTVRDDAHDDASDADAVGTAWLHVVYCPDPEVVGQRLQLSSDAEPVLIGREVAGGVSLRDPRLSRLHLRFVWDIAQRGFRLGDCDSSNGTYVNGERVRNQLIGANDVIRCGDSLLVVDTDQSHEQLQQRAKRIAPSGLSAIIHGETGVGKEVTARFIHEHSGARGEFVAVNCAVLSRELVAAELFGHTRGAFTGATTSRAGLFVGADNGTLLLDEIGDLPLDAQPTLLRALQEGAVRPVGSDQVRRVNVRVLAATHVDLFAAAKRGAFRQDLLARLAQVRLRVPALRERRSQILSLFRDFAKASGYELELSTNAAEALLLWHYPFNVRELRSIVDSLVAELHGRRVDLSALRRLELELATRGSFSERPGQPSTPGDAGLRRRRLQRLLKLHGGNVTQVASELGSNRSQVYRWMKSLGLSAEGYRN